MAANELEKTTTTSEYVSTDKVWMQFGDVDATKDFSLLFCDNSMVNSLIHAKAGTSRSGDRIAECSYSLTVD